MKDDLLKQAVRMSCHRITKDEVIAGNRKRFSQLGLDDHDIQVMADAVGLELEDLLLLDSSVSGISRPKPSKPGTPGRKDETFDIAVFAKERRDREPQMTWDEIYRDWMRTYPDDKPVKDKECIREAHRRFFGDKYKARKRASKKP
ncbi:hypothetical protein [Rosistilla oblonga]|uniref:hypothetical protein n=1 Tax=Rosistilla oblonga TaxID=2527990 RepID=UPI003A978029